MAKAKKRTTKRRRVTRNLSAGRRRRRTTRPRTMSAAPRKRRRRKGLSSGGGPNVSYAKAGVNTLAGASGGALYAVGTIPFPKLKWYWKAGGGYTLAFIGHKMKQPNVASGMAGATTYDLIHNFWHGLNDGDLEEVEYVDPDTLSDTDYEDEEGNAIVMDDDGVMYALNDSGELEAVGDAYSLQDGNHLTSVSMLPLNPMNDIYSLSGGGNIYALNSAVGTY